MRAEKWLVECNLSPGNHGIVGKGRALLWLLKEKKKIIGDLEAFGLQLQDVYTFFFFLQLN